VTSQVWELRCRRNGVLYPSIEVHVLPHLLNRNLRSPISATVTASSHAAFSHCSPSTWNNRVELTTAHLTHPVQLPSSHTHQAYTSLGQDCHALYQRRFKPRYPVQIDPRADRGSSCQTVNIGTDWGPSLSGLLIGEAKQQHKQLTRAPYQHRHRLSNRRGIVPWTFSQPRPGHLISGAS